MISKKILFVVCFAFLIVRTASAEPAQPVVHNIKTVNHAFSPGEKLTYDISWSKILQAGTAVLEVREGKTKEGRRTYQFVATTRSEGVVEAFYKVRDTVISEVDAE